MGWQWTYDGTPDDSVNLAVADGSEAVFYLKQTMKQAGWVVKESSDGVTYDPAGDRITNGGAGLHGMANDRAWFRIQSPAGAGGREYTFQRTSGGNTNWRCMYSASAGFTGGTPDHLQTPSATDEQILLGGGTDAAPTFVQGFSGSASHIHVGANTTAPYDWYLVGVANGAVNAAPWMLGVGLVPGLSPAGDTDQWITGWTYALPDITAFITPSVGLGKGFFKHGLSGEAFVNYPFLYDPSSITFLPVNPITGNDEAIPFFLGRVTSVGNGGLKGWVSSVKLRLTASRQIPDCFDDAGPPITRWAYFNALVVPYPTTVEPIT